MNYDRFDAVGCWAHARRPFFELHEGSVEALDVLLLIQWLYDIDQRADGAATVHPRCPHLALTHALGRGASRARADPRQVRSADRVGDTAQRAGSGRHLRA